MNQYTGESARGSKFYLLPDHTGFHLSVALTDNEHILYEHIKAPKLTEDEVQSMITRMEDEHFQLVTNDAQKETLDIPDDKEYRFIHASGADISPEEPEVLRNDDGEGTENIQSMDDKQIFEYESPTDRVGELDSEIQSTSLPTPL